MLLLAAGCVDPGSTPPLDATHTDAFAVEGEALPELANAWRLRFSLQAPSTATATCTSPDAPDEHHVRSLPEASDHDLALFGLLAGTRYDCWIEAEPGAARASFDTPPAPGWMPRWILERDPTAPHGVDDPSSAYTLLNHGTDIPNRREPKLLIVDRDGRLRWYLRVPTDATDLDAQYLGGGQILFGGGYAVPPTVADLAGRTVLQPPANNGAIYHHHVERLDDGTFATLREVDNTDGARRWTGFAVDVLSPDMTQRVWSWNSQQGVDAGWLPGEHDRDDVYHANALVIDDETLYVNLRELNQLVAIDRQTGAHRFTLGPDGDFALLEDGRPADTEAWFHRPHAPERHGDRWWFYDNGVRFAADKHSRIAHYVIDEDARTAELVWTFTEPGWYEPIWGDVDRLESGNILYVRAHCDSCGGGRGQRTEIVEVESRHRRGRVAVAVRRSPRRGIPRRTHRRLRAVRQPRVLRLIADPGGPSGPARRKGAATPR